MASENAKHKILFLVDVSVVTRHHELHGSIDGTINLIRSAAVKVLLHFTTLVKDETKQLQWGYKFFNFHNQRYSCRNIFRDVENKQFEEFEHDLEQLLEEKYNHQSAYIKSKNASENSNKKTRLKANIHGSSGCDRSDVIGTQLKNIIYDFLWQGPDLCSPVKLPRRKSFRGITEPECENINAVFLLSDCPHSLSDISHFATCDTSITTEELLAEILPTSVLQQFHYAKKLRLFWIDTNVLPTMHVVNDLSGISLIDQCLSRVGGCVIPANCIVQTGLLSSANILQCQKDGNVMSASLLPVPSLINFYTSNEHSPPHSAKYNLKAQFKHKIFGSFSISLDPIVHPSEKDSSCHVQHFLSICSSIQNSRASSSNNQQQCSSTTESDISCMDIVPVLNIERHNYSLSWLESSLVYVVNDTGSNEEVAQSPNFSSLVQSLAQTNQAMVVHICPANSHQSFPALVQPLTSIAATLTLIRHEMMYSFDKMRCFEKSSNNQDENEKQMIDMFVNEKCLQLMPEVKTLSKVNPSTSLTVKEPLAMDFNPNILTNFFIPEANSHKQDKILSILRDNESHKQSREEEQQLLRNLQKHYLHNKAKKLPQMQASTVQRSPRKVTRSPRKGSRSPRKSQPQRGRGRTGTPRKKSATRASPTKKFRQALKRVRSSTGPTRSDLIFKKSKEALARQQSDVTEDDNTEASVREVKGQNKVKRQIKVPEFGSEEELVNYIQESYDKIVSGENSVISGVQTISMLTLHYYQTVDVQTAQDKTVSLFSKHLLVTNKKMREKYKGKENDEDKIRELELQSVLYMETSSLHALDLTEESMEKTTTQIAGMLRSLSFHKDPSYLSRFLQEVLLDCYIGTLPRLLASIYEELLQPLPPQLESIFSPETTDPSSVATTKDNVDSVRSDLSSVMGSLCPPSNRNLRDRTHTRRYSSFQLEPKRQIALKAPKEKSNSSRPSRSSARIASAKKTIKQQQGGATEAKKVRRNLFDEEGGVKLQRRQSVAVMETGPAPSPSMRQTPRKKAPPTTAGRKTPKAHHKLRTKLVSETPHHKQKDSVVWRRLEKERRRANTASDVTVVQESPLKAVIGKSPKKPSSVLPRRSSFYSSSQSASRSVISSTQSGADKMERLEQRLRLPLLSPGWKETAYKPGDLASRSTPRRIQPKTLFAQLSSPSPRKGFHKNKAAVVVGGLNFDSPSKNTRARSVFMSPEIDTRVEDTPQKAVQSCLMSPKPKDTPRRHVKSVLFSPVNTKISPVDTETRGFETANIMNGSPMMTRSQTPLKKARTNLSALFSPDKNMQSSVPTRLRTPVKALSLTPKKRAAVNLQADFVKISEIGLKLSQEHEEKEPVPIQNPFDVKTPSKRKDVINNINNRNLLTPTTRSQRRRSKSPSVSPDINSWPRKKPRTSPVLSKCSESGGGLSDNDESPKLRRKIRSSHFRTSPRVQDKSADEKENSCRSSEHVENTQTPKKGKRKLQEPLDHTPSKRRRTLLSSCADTTVGSSEYFSSSEVFIESDNACDYPIASSSSSSNTAVNSLNLSITQSAVFGNESSQGFMTFDKSKIKAEMESSRNVPSPVFSSPVACKFKPIKSRENILISESTNQTSRTNSPVFDGLSSQTSRPSPRKAVLASPFSPLKRIAHQQAKESPSGTTKVGNKNFSPLSSRGLLTLLESPMLGDAKKQTYNEDRKTPKSKKMLDI